MTDTLITIFIVGGCALFLGVRALRNFRGTGGGCACSCTSSCAVAKDTCNINTNEKKTDE